MVLDIREYQRLIERAGARPSKKCDPFRELRAILRLAKAFLGDRRPSRNGGESPIGKLWNDPLHAYHR